MGDNMTRREEEARVQLRHQLREQQERLNEVWTMQVCITLTITITIVTLFIVGMLVLGFTSVTKPSPMKPPTTITSTEKTIGKDFIESPSPGPPCRPRWAKNEVKPENHLVDIPIPIPR